MLSVQFEHCKNGEMKAIPRKVDGAGLGFSVFSGLGPIFAGQNDPSEIGDVGGRGCSWSQTGGMEKALNFSLRQDPCPLHDGVGAVGDVAHLET